LLPAALVVFAVEVKLRVLGTVTTNNNNKKKICLQQQKNLFLYFIFVKKKIETSPFLSTYFYSGSDKFFSIFLFLFLNFNLFFL